MFGVGVELAVSVGVIVGVLVNDATALAVCFCPATKVIAATAATSSVLVGVGLAGTPVLVEVGRSREVGDSWACAVVLVAPAAVCASATAACAVEVA